MMSVEALSILQWSAAFHCNSLLEPTVWVVGLDNGIQNSSPYNYHKPVVLRRILPSNCDSYRMPEPRVALSEALQVENKV